MSQASLRVGLDTAPLAMRLGRRAKTVLLALGGFAALVVMWQIIATLAKGLPSPSETMGEFVRLVSHPFYDKGPNDKGIGRQLTTSLLRVFGGFGIAAAIGIPLGLLMGASKAAWSAVNPIIQILKPVSPLAWFPIWLVVFKDGPKASIWVIFITAVWPVLINTAAGAKSVPEDQRHVATVFKFSKLSYVRRILVPNAMPGIITGLRLSMGIGWMVIVAVEMLSGGAGIGFFVWDAYNASRLPSVITAIVLIGVLGFGLDTVFMTVSRRFARQTGSAA